MTGAFGREHHGIRNPKLAASRVRRAVEATALLVVTVAVASVPAAATPPEPPASQSTAAFCAAAPPSTPFRDVPSGNAHRDNIRCLAASGITRGRNATTYDTRGSVTREQMASFVARKIDLANTLEGTPPLNDLPTYDGSPDYDDVSASNPHFTNIMRLSQAGIVRGRAARRYQPGGLVTREEVAAFIHRATTFLTGAPYPTSDDYFTDDEGSFAEADINAIASRGIAVGDGVDRYGPQALVPRDQMASFLIRALSVHHADKRIRPLPAPVAGRPFTVPAIGAYFVNGDNPAGGDAAIDAGDTIVLTFNEAMKAPDRSDRIRIEQRGGTSSTITCDVPNTCEISTDMRTIAIEYRDRTAVRAPAKIVEQGGFSDAASPPASWDLTAASADTTIELAPSPRSLDATVANDIATLGSTLNSGDVITLTFDREVAEPSPGDRLDVGKLDHHIVCGGNATCRRMLEPATKKMTIIQMKLTERPFAPSDPAASVQLPVEINGHDGFTDHGGSDWDIAGSPDKVLECSDTCS